MASIRDIKRKARRDLHRKMRVPALYIAPGNGAPALLHIRVHTKWDATTMDGGSGNGKLTSRLIVEPKLLFMLDELAEQGVRLVRKGVISVEPGEAYTLEGDEPEDDISVTWVVTPLRGDRSLGLPVPGDTDG